MLEATFLWARKNDFWISFLSPQSFFRKVSEGSSHFPTMQPFHACQLSKIISFEDRLNNVFEGRWQGVRLIFPRCKRFTLVSWAKYYHLETTPTILSQQGGSRLCSFSHDAHARQLSTILSFKGRELLLCVDPFSSCQSLDPLIAAPVEGKGQLKGGKETNP